MTGNVRDFVKMFKVMLAFLFFGMLVASAQDTDLCSCSDVQQSLKDLTAEVANLKKLNVVVKDLYEKLEKQFNWPSSPNVACPRGFTYLPLAKSCYKVVYESHNWTSAGKKCQELDRDSHLVDIASKAENNALKSFLETELSENVGNTACIPREKPFLGNVFWTSGQRMIENNCQSNFVWKTFSDERLPLVFSNWKPGEPNCGGDKESCIHIWPNENFLWNDDMCNLEMCLLCEYEP